MALSEYLPLGILRFFKWGFVGLAILLLVSTGVSAFSRPGYELVYYLGTPKVQCGDYGIHNQILHLLKNDLEQHWTMHGGYSRCWVYYSLKIGNAGRYGQPQVAVQLYKEYADRIILGPAFRNEMQARYPLSNLTRRAIKNIPKGIVQNYLIGPLHPNEIVIMQLLLQHKEGAAIVPWNDLLAEIDAPLGEAVEGDPEATIFLRIMLALFFWSGQDTVEELVERVLQDGTDWNEEDLLGG